MKVRLEVVDIHNSTMNVKNGKKTTKKILPGITQTLSPVMDGYGRVITGVKEEEYNEIIAKDMSATEPLPYREYYKSFSVKVNEGGRTFDRTIPKHELIYRFLKTHPDVAQNKETVNAAVHTYYLVDEEAEAVNKLGTMEAKMKAYSALNDMTPKEMKDILFLYGVDGSTISDSLAKAKLGEYIEENPTKFISLFQDSGKEHRIVLRKLLRSQEVRKEGGALFYGEADDNPVFLGGSEDLAVEFLKDVKNHDLYLSFLKKTEE